MENSAGSIAAIHATLRKGSVTAMPREEFEREKMYQTTMCIFRSMLRKGLLTEEEYRKAERLMVKKYRLYKFSCGIITQEHNGSVIQFARPAVQDTSMATGIN